MLQTFYILILICTSAGAFASELNQDVIPFMQVQTVMKTVMKRNQYFCLHWRPKIWNWTKSKIIDSLYSCSATYICTCLTLESSLFGVVVVVFCPGELVEVLEKPQIWMQMGMRTWTLTQGLDLDCRIVPFLHISLVFARIPSAVTAEFSGSYVPYDASLCRNTVKLSGYFHGWECDFRADNCCFFHEEEVTSGCISIRIVFEVMLEIDNAVIMKVHWRGDVDPSTHDCPKAAPFHCCSNSITDRFTMACLKEVLDCADPTLCQIPERHLAFILGTAPIWLNVKFLEPSGTTSLINLRAPVRKTSTKWASFL